MNLRIMRVFFKNLEFERLTVHSERTFNCVFLETMKFQKHNF